VATQRRGVGGWTRGLVERRVGSWSRSLSPVQDPIVVGRLPGPCNGLLTRLRFNSERVDESSHIQDSTYITARLEKGESIAAGRSRSQ